MAASQCDTNLQTRYPFSNTTNLLPVFKHHYGLNTVQRVIVTKSSNRLLSYHNNARDMIFPSCREGNCYSLYNLGWVRGGRTIQTHIEPLSSTGTMLSSSPRLDSLTYIWVSTQTLYTREGLTHSSMKTTHFSSGEVQRYNGTF